MPPALARWRPLAPLLSSFPSPRERPAGVELSLWPWGVRPAERGSGPAAPPRPGQSPPRWVFFPRSSPPPTLRFPEARPASLAELPPGVPSAPGASLSSDSYGLRRVPLASGAFAPIAGRPVAHGRVHLQVTFCKRPAQPGPACPSQRAEGARRTTGLTLSQSPCNPRVLALRTGSGDAEGPGEVRPHSASAQGARALARRGAPSLLAAFR